MSDQRDILKGWPMVTPIMDEAELRAVADAAKADEDNILRPTHVVRVDGKIVGALGLSPLPVTRYWLSRELKAWQSLNIISVAENVQRAHGAQDLLLMHRADSPFTPVLGRLGYAPVGSAAFAVKLGDASPATVEGDSHGKSH